LEILDEDYLELQMKNISMIMFEDSGEKIYLSDITDVISNGIYYVNNYQ